MALALGTGVLLSVLGCDEAMSHKVLPSGGYTPQATKPARPVPKTIDDVQKIGIPVYPGSVLGDGEDHTRLDDRAYARVYFTKMYAPADVPAVVGFYMKGLQGTTRQGGVDNEQVKGKNKDGADLDIRIGPAADHTKSLVMVWMTEPKMPH